jgi:hypothetical protein
MTSGNKNMITKKYITQNIRSMNKYIIIIITTMMMMMMMMMLIIMQSVSYLILQKTIYTLFCNNLLIFE